MPGGRACQLPFGIIAARGARIDANSGFPSAGATKPKIGFFRGEQNDGENGLELW
jgi:hypothetical protein